MRRAGRLRALSDHDQAGEQRQHWPGAFSWLSQVTGGSNWAGENKRHSGATCGSCRGRGWGLTAALCDVVLCASSQLEQHPRRWRFLQSPQPPRSRTQARQRGLCSVRAVEADSAVCSVIFLHQIWYFFDAEVRRWLPCVLELDKCQLIVSPHGHNAHLHLMWVPRTGAEILLLISDFALPSMWDTLHTSASSSRGRENAGVVFRSIRAVL